MAEQNSARWYRHLRCDRLFTELQRLKGCYKNVSSVKLISDAYSLNDLFYESVCTSLYVNLEDKLPCTVAAFPTSSVLRKSCRCSRITRYHMPFNALNKLTISLDVSSLEKQPYTKHKQVAVLYFKRK